MIRAEDSVTFAIVGHNEAPSLRLAVAAAQAAARPGDAVVFVDSASTDGSDEAVAATGVDILRAPLGKGAAMSTAADACETEWVCFLDGDIFGSEHNIAHRLRETIDRSSDVCVGDFSDRHEGILSNTVAIYTPLVAALFPEARDRFGSKPLTGFRAIRRPDQYLPYPDGFGVEAHLNVAAAVGGARVRVVDVGWYEGRFRYKPFMGREIAAALLDAAVRLGRLDPDRRQAFETWTEQVVTVIAGYRGGVRERRQFLTNLMAQAARPLPEPR